jgi:predicted RNA-binding protein YlqC (UPF0109 family)
LTQYPKTTPVSAVASINSTASLLIAIVRALVMEPDQVSVESFTKDGLTILRLKVGGSDLGRVIGKHGRTAQSLRAVIQAVEVKLQHRFQLEIQQELSVLKSGQA